jgi:ATP-dependent RNA helicase DHX29
LAERVSKEVGDKPPLGSTAWVGYQVKNDSNINGDTVIQYCTTGILLRVIESNPLLEGYTHIVVDEVHERTLESDFLLLLLKRILLSRTDVRLILMSATADAEHFAAYFSTIGTVPCLSIPGKVYPVSSFFLEDAVAMTGYRFFSDSPYATKTTQLTSLVQKISFSDKRGRKKNLNVAWNEEMEPLDDTVEGTLARMDPDRIDFDLIAKIVRYICQTSSVGSILVFLPGVYEIKRAIETIRDDMDDGGYPLWLLPLHGGLDRKMQSLVFNPPERGTRKVVLATNVAETGITIPDVVYVIDCCRVREIGFDHKRGITRLSDVMISKANAKQRRGRAGRVQDGYCFHLITKERFGKLPDHRLPEVQRLPLQDICLRFRSILKESDSLFDQLQSLIDPPPAKNIQAAVELLQSIHALDASERITGVGTFLSQLPLDVQIGNILLHGLLFSCLDPIVTVCALLSMGKSVFGTEKNQMQTFLKLVNKESDILSWISMYNQWQDLCIQRRPLADIRAFCRNYNLVQSHLELVHETRLQIYRALFSVGMIKQNPGLTSTPTQHFFEPQSDFRSRDELIVSAAYGCGTSGNMVIKTKPIGAIPGELVLCSNPETPIKLHQNSFCTQTFPSLTFAYTYSQVQMKKSSQGKYHAVLFDMSKVPMLCCILSAQKVVYRPVQHKFSLEEDKYSMRCRPVTASYVLVLRELFQEAKADFLRLHWDDSRAKMALVCKILQECK